MSQDIDAPASAIESAFRKQSLQCHPDWIPSILLQSSWSKMYDTQKYTYFARASVCIMDRLFSHAATTATPYF